ncbi:uncharacterized protein MONBRDRAFT_12709 [Monosiga brevicollis MX1]|uniref:E2F transcription factor CC-MB domain-containing protein n=1 Tax=Monosiga brevicollis TaxID=81824 RepID=A9VD34_MONBE|nr:uncharacterized protein MONBRDRAFT_12709 [Monosiga brevicollis MX1]EDQ84611.1 predicted protein [Monosiga brevicollis MX1]|eukprot:XP_001750638.1 hypothetical protein [Monosiga brevicollis MX1]
MSHSSGPPAAAAKMLEIDSSQPVFPEDRLATTPERRVHHSQPMPKRARRGASAAVQLQLDTSNNTSTQPQDDSDIEDADTHPDSPLLGPGAPLFEQTISLLQALRTSDQGLLQPNDNYPAPVADALQELGLIRRRTRNDEVLEWVPDATSPEGQRVQENREDELKSLDDQIERLKLLHSTSAASMRQLLSKRQSLAHVAKSDMATLATVRDRTVFIVQAPPGSTMTVPTPNPSTSQFTLQIQGPGQVAVSLLSQTQPSLSDLHAADPDLVTNPLSFMAPSLDQACSSTNVVRSHSPSSQLAASSTTASTVDSRSQAARKRPKPRPSTLRSVPDRILAATPLESPLRDPLRSNRLSMDPSYHEQDEPMLLSLMLPPSTASAVPEFADSLHHEYRLTDPCISLLDTFADEDDDFAEDSAALGNDVPRSA